MVRSTFTKYVCFLMVSAALVFTSSGCSTLREAQTPSEADINVESAKAYQEVKSKAQLSTRKDWNEMVQRVAKRIAAASGENFEWEIILIDNPEPNAWCMPGGKMAVYTGIMPILKTEGALAAVMGHEVAHATRRHGQKAYARAIEEQQTAVLLGVAAGVAGQVLCKTENCRLIAGLGGPAAALALSFFNRKFSREDESDADQVGQIYMAKAGYDPAESIVLWERMNAGKNAEPPEWMSTHPSDTNRRAKLSQWLPQAQQVYQGVSQKYGRGSTIQ
ncbi:MAG: M48 family metallopeptidase [Bdellovibrionaceae bacterium]|nr:M48 family metallopeptidase [Pseudobdellovibrionaceae bacterium]